MRCLPSMRTTARTGPRCSTFAPLISPFEPLPRGAAVVAVVEVALAEQDQPAVAGDLGGAAGDGAYEPLAVLADHGPDHPGVDGDPAPALGDGDLLGGRGGCAGGELVGAAGEPLPRRVRGPFERAVGPVGGGPGLEGHLLAVGGGQRERTVAGVGALGPGDAEGGARGRAEAAVLQPGDVHRLVGGLGGGAEGGAVGGGLRGVLGEQPGERYGGAGGGGLEEVASGDRGHVRFTFRTGQVHDMSAGGSALGAGGDGAGGRWRPPGGRWCRERVRRVRLGCGAPPPPHSPRGRPPPGRSAAASARRRRRAPRARR